MPKKKLKLYRLRGLSREKAKRLAKYALKNPKLTSIKTQKRATKKYFGQYLIKAEGMKRDRKGQPLKGTHFVARER